MGLGYAFMVAMGHAGRQEGSVRDSGVKSKELRSRGLNWVRVAVGDEVPSYGGRTELLRAIVRIPC